MSCFDLIIAGAGASGLMAALSARRKFPQAKILLLERQDRPLRKVKAAGNGRCNLSNKDLSGSHYFSVATSPKQKDKIIKTVFNCFSSADTVKFFNDLGLFLRTDQAGRLYPYGEQGDLVVACLLRALAKAEIDLLTGLSLTAIDRQDNFLELTLLSGNSSLQSRSETGSLQKKMRTKNLILACGSTAGGGLGATDLGYRLSENLGLEVSRLQPALVPLVLSDKDIVKSLSGQRFKGQASLYRDRQFVATSQGEFLFNKQGLSGIAGMELGRFVQDPDRHRYNLTIDFVPDLSQDDLVDYLTGLWAGSGTVGRSDLKSLAEAFVKEKIASELASRSGSIAKLASLLKALKLDLENSMGSDQAQVMAGGVCLHQVHLPEFCLKPDPRIYLTGELLDIDGQSGGYNLQWAWSSGFLAGLLSKPY